MGNLALFYNLGKQLCDSTNPICLYSMDTDTVGTNGLVRRMGGTFNNDPWYGSGNWQYFDCSGFVGYLLWKAGFTERHLGFTTFGEENVFKNLGWTVMDYVQGMTLQNGDVVWYNKYNEVKQEWEGHTEVVFNAKNRWTGGAKGRGSSWGNRPVKDKDKQVSIGEYNTDSWYSWKKLARCTNQSVNYDIISVDRYLSDNEMISNAYLIANKLATLGYSMPVICAILGNMARESTLTPILNERGGGGYGLVQWTPKTDLTDIVSLYNLGDYTKYDVQCEVFDYECGVKAPNTQWYDDEHRYLTTVPYMPFASFKVLTTDQYDIDNLTSAFMVYYERPYWNPDDYRLDIRREWANRFYGMFKDGIFNGIGAFNLGNNIEERKKLLLFDYIRRKNSLLTL